MVLCDHGIGVRVPMGFSLLCVIQGLPLWSSGQSYWLGVLVRFPALPDVLSSSGSGTGSTQPREYN
jgi:hypothetical protein